MKPAVSWGWLLLSLIAFTFIGYGVDRSQFPVLMVTVGVLFLGYFMVLRNVAGLLEDYRFLYWAGMAFRVIFIMALPQLSDDYFRFLWDGKMMLSGVNPYTVLPQEAASIDAIGETLLNKMNSLGYYTIYPPLDQLVFMLGAVGMKTGSIFSGVVVLRLVILLGEVALGTLLPNLLTALGIKRSFAMWYWLNPLVIIEVTGNLHFEGLVALLLISFIWQVIKGNVKRSGVLLGLAAAVKLLPLIFLPALIRKWGWIKTSIVGTVALVVIVLLYFPFVDARVVHNMATSLDLYFRNFEFNGGLYFLVREISTGLVGWNPIAFVGPALALLSMLGILAVQLIRKPGSDIDWITTLQWSLTIYLLGATTVHPWYVVPLIALSAFTGYIFPLVWSGLIFLSYGAYQTGEYNQNLTWVMVEYLILASFMAWEFFINKRKPVVA